MPHQPTRPTSENRTDDRTVRLPAAGATPAATETPAEVPKPDLTVSKVAAAAGAAATSALLGSYLGAAGTVTGAAVGAVASTVSAVLYQRSLERARATVSRIRPVVVLPRPRRSSEATAPTGEETVLLRPEPPARPRRRPRAVLLGVLGFVLALAAITGVEAARGETITTGESGTSVGRVVAPPPVADPADEEPSTPTDEDTTSTGTPDPSGSTTTAPTGTPASDAEAGPDVLPEDAADTGSGTDPGTDPGDGAAPTGEAPAPTRSGSAG